jgi:hypothetical protein
MSFTIAAGPRQRSHYQVGVRGTHDHILLFQIRDFPNLEGQVPVFISPRKRMAQLYPQALGSLFFASYDSQGYGGDIRPRLHTGLNPCLPPTLYNNSIVTRLSKNVTAPTNTHATIKYLLDSSFSMRSL